MFPNITESFLYYYNINYIPLAFPNTLPSAIRRIDWAPLKEHYLQSHPNIIES